MSITECRRVFKINVVKMFVLLIRMLPVYNQNKRYEIK